MPSENAPSSIGNHMMALQLRKTSATINIMTFDPKIYKTIVFVRHGQYEKDPERLTSLGKAQAHLASQVVRDLKPHRLYSSTMPRAIETASYIEKQCQMKAIKRDMFREGILPGLEAVTKTDKAARETMKKNQIHADKAFDFLFKAPRSGATTHVVVAHGNVIRYWVCKALGIDHKKWVKMDLQQGSLTTVRVDKEGNAVLLGFADIGHVPLEQRTYI
ncbi:histidine phosphatase family protein [Bdellovibrio sp. HCB-162]|uniref:histidine phosphatase family protein n=1 Tax=Bdellovibrio sp. HCB-162 TaxID=3394234 RepID=UPI0039BD8EEA